MAFCQRLGTINNLINVLMNNKTTGARLRPVGGNCFCREAKK